MNKEIRKIMKDLKITQGAMAERIKISRIALNRYLLGKSDLGSAKFLLILHELDMTVVKK